MATSSESTISVRAATDGDRISARDLISGATPRGRASLVLLRAGQGLLWVAYQGQGDREKLVGLLLATVQIDSDSEEPVGYIQELLVHPAYRRLGVAMHLLDAAERFFLEEQRFSQIYLATSPDNEAALRLYRSRGYTAYQVRLAKRRLDASSDTAAPDREHDGP
jgi:ribosomal protein S18 acetylase RimI-like enzyme